MSKKLYLFRVYLALAAVAGHNLDVKDQEPAIWIQEYSVFDRQNGICVIVY